MKIKRDVKIEYVIFVVIFFVMLVFNMLTPMVSDDYAFAFDGHGNRVASISKIFPLLAELRNSANGRVFSHFFVYLFQMLPRVVFQVVNSAVTASILFSIFAFFKSEQTNKNIVLLICATAMIWIFTPEFGSVFLGLTGSCNYSWGIALFLPYILPLYRQYNDKQSFFDQNGKLLFKILYIIVSFVVGAYSENGSTAVISVSFFFILLDCVKKRRLNVSCIISFVFLCAGFLFMMTAPAELGGRTSDFQISILFDNAKYCLEATEAKCRYLYYINAGLLALAAVKKVRKEVIFSSLILIFGGILSIAVFVFAAYLPDRSFDVMVIFNVVSAVILCAELWDVERKAEIVVLTAVLCVSFTFSFIRGSGDIFSIYLQSRNRNHIIAEAKSSGNADVIVPPFVSSTKYPAVIHEMLYGPEWWYNDCIATYYGVNSITSTEYLENNDSD